MLTYVEIFTWLLCITFYGGGTCIGLTTLKTSFRSIHELYMSVMSFFVCAIRFKHLLVPVLSTNVLLGLLSF